jgi:hypothetical protein
MLQIVIRLRNMGGVGGDMRIISNSYELGTLPAGSTWFTQRNSETLAPLTWAHNTLIQKPGTGFDPELRTFQTTAHLHMQPRYK